MLYYIFVFSILLVIVLSVAYFCFLSCKLEWWKRILLFVMLLHMLCIWEVEMPDLLNPTDGRSVLFMLVCVVASIGLVHCHRFRTKLEFRDSSLTNILGKNPRPGVGRLLILLGSATTSKTKCLYVACIFTQILSLFICVLAPMFLPIIADKLSDYNSVYSEAQTSDYNYYAADTVAMPEYCEESATVDYIPADTVSVAEDYEIPTAAPAIDTPTTAQSSEAPTSEAYAPKEDQVFDAVEQAPQFPGGEEALLRFVADNIRYPALAIENGHQGTVVVRFVVTHTGDVGKVVIARGKTPELDKEAVRVVKKLPKFTPANQNGLAVNAWYTLPIRFKLQM